MSKSKQRTRKAAKPEAPSAEPAGELFVPPVASDQVGSNNLPATVSSTVNVVTSTPSAPEPEAPAESQQPAKTKAEPKAKSEPKAKGERSFRVRHGRLVVGPGQIRVTGDRVLASELTAKEIKFFLGDKTLAEE